MVLKFRVYEQTISLQPTKAEPRQGSRDYLELQFSFSADWNDLLKYVYIQHGEVSVPHDLVDGSIIVDEYFTEQAEFNVTMFGRSVDGSIEVPTNVVTVFLKESNTLWEKDAPEPQNSWVAQVIDARDEALAAAIRAENAAIHQPYPNVETGTWWVWDVETGAYKNTGVAHSGGGSVSLDKTLTTEGMAADAKAVGDAINRVNSAIEAKQDRLTDHDKHEIVLTGMTTAPWTDEEKAAICHKLTIIKNALDDGIAVAGAQYYLGERKTVSIVLPDYVEPGNMITVSWYNGDTAATLSITGTLLSFDYTPSANTRSEINALWDGTYWAVLGNEMAVPSEVTA